MRRREFVTLVGGALSWPQTASAQEPGRVYRLGIIIPASLVVRADDVIE